MAYQYGGQAVIEGVMMRGPKDFAVAVRGPAGDILVDRKHLNPVQERYPILKKPIFRGVVALIDSMVLGIKTLTYSANVAIGEDEEELSLTEIILTVGVAFGLTVLLFVVIPTAAAHFLSGFMGTVGQSIAEGILRILIFLGYVVGISLLKDIQRVFQYHGAEHKVIHAYEAGEDLADTESIQRYSTLHPRCGTAFLLIVMVLAIFFFSFLNTPGLTFRIVSRVLLLPLIAGIAYEIIKISAKHGDESVIKAVIAPGLWLQKLTTREPDDGMIEVAVKALDAVLAMEEGRSQPGISEAAVSEVRTDV